MARRVPLLSTAIVLLAVATMIGLGFWQLGRLAEKEALIARYSQAGTQAREVAFPTSGDGQDLLFRRSAIDCAVVQSVEPVAGRNADGRAGWAQRASCTDARSVAVVLVDLGWTLDPQPVEWDGGPVAGIVAPGPRLVVTNPPAGLQPLARPDPSDLPNNHLAYAGQWFFFALTALVIYVLALRRRWRASEA